MSIVSWSQAAKIRTDSALQRADKPSPDGKLPLTAESRFHRAVIRAEATGALTIEIASPRPLRLWLDGEAVLDEPLFWRSFQRQLRAAVVVPVEAGEHELLVEVGPRPHHPPFVDNSCPSRNREAVMAALAARFPDSLTVAVRCVPGAKPPAASLRFLPSQFQREGLTWQEIMVRPLPGFGKAPTVDVRSTAEAGAPTLRIENQMWPGQLHDATGDAERGGGLRRWFVPVAGTGELAPLRGTGKPDPRPEPEAEVAAWAELRVEGAVGAVTVRLPVHESLGRLAPRREWRAVEWPDKDRLMNAIPKPVLPADKKHFLALYSTAWELLLRLIRHPKAESGLPGGYLATSEHGFFNEQFVWDTSFTAMAAAYGWRCLPAHASLDTLYSRQFDGGYIHRETDTRDGMPIMFEPDFSPNPPLIAVAELAIARISGNTARVGRVYPALCDHHRWLEANRRLPDGTFWTTGLANGLDNSPSLGDGYPCLTAQMAHHAECLSQMASLLGRADEARQWRSRRDEIGAALNGRLWSEELKFYSTSLPGGKHNTNKVVTGFWPLWAGVVPPDRVEHLAKHLKDPRSFWRHHPVPSLAADSPEFVPAGNYWLGSTWAPTNGAVIKGFWRAGREDLARETATRHLQVMSEVFAATGSIWENYCSEASKPGSWSGAGYSWTTLGPIALLLEVVIGLEPDAPNRRLRWSPPAGEAIGVERYPLGHATVRAVQIPGPDGDRIEIDTDWPITVELVRGQSRREVACGRGRTEAKL